jgi:hypothetical protein
MTQTLDALDVGGQFAQRDGARATGAAASATATKASKSGTFAITFGIAFAVLYTVFERLNWPLFTYHPVSGKLEFWKQMTGVGPPMFWYGWLVLAGITALAVSWIATMVSDQWLRRATVFGCLLAALWPAALVGLKVFIVDWATFDASFLDSVWIAAIPGLIGAAAITALVPAQWVQRTWSSWLLVAPLGGLVVLGYSLQQYFVR